MGSGFTKMGYAGNYEPAYIIPTVYAENAALAKGGGRGRGGLDDLAPGLPEGRGVPPLSRGRGRGAPRRTPGVNGRWGSNFLEAGSVQRGLALDFLIGSEALASYQTYQVPPPPPPSNPEMRVVRDPDGPPEDLHSRAPRRHAEEDRPSRQDPPVVVPMTPPNLPTMHWLDAHICQPAGAKRGSFCQPFPRHSRSLIEVPRLSKPRPKQACTRSW